MNRSLTVVGNWKMFLDWQEAGELARQIRQGLARLSNWEASCQIGVCPPFPLIPKVAEELAESSVFWGGQNLYPKDEGAFTGEVSGKMLQSLGCQCVILGHSERRQYFHESNAFIREKLMAALSFHLRPILCIGEKLEERRDGKAFQVVEEQLCECLEGFGSGMLQPLILAYEPVWAIGTGVAAEPKDAEEMHQFIRRLLAKLFGEEFAERQVILYGGSVKPDNAAALASQENVDGALVGGASLKADSFLKIVEEMSRAKGMALSR